MHRIVIDEIMARVYVGVTEKERRRRQRISVSLRIFPEARYDEIDDTIDRTVNYSSVRLDVLELLRKGTFALIETLAREIAEYLVGRYAMKRLEVTLKKYPYRDTKSVSYTLMI